MKPSATIHARPASYPRASGSYGEVTLPGEVGASPGSDLRSTRFLVAVSGLTSVVLALVVVLGFQLLRHVLRGAGGPSVSAGECVDGEDDVCGDGFTCVARRCAPLVQAKVCEVGDPCDRRCTAPASLRCGEQGRYVAAAPPSRDVCFEPSVRAFLDDIEKKCGSLERCADKDLEEFAIEHDEFLRLISTFPGTAAVHFSRGKPDSALYPDGKAMDHYVAGLEPFLGEVGRASTVLLVGLSSRDTPSDIPDARQKADHLTLSRAHAVERMILAGARKVGSTDLVDAIDDKLKLVLLGKRQQVTAAFFSGDKVAIRSIAWDEKSEQQLRGLIEAGDRLHAGSRRWRDATINQTVFVVPIPCRVGGK